MRPRGSAELLSDRRRRALKLLREKWSLNEVARRIGCAASSVMRWRNAWRRRGEDSLRVRFSPGRPRRLTKRQERRLIRILLQGAVAHGYRTELWTTKRVAEVIEETFHIPCHFNTAARAQGNLRQELPHWDFDRVVRESRDDWNRWLGRIEVEGGSEAQKIKFYTDLWHALLGRRIVSDAHGYYRDMTGPKPRIRQVGHVDLAPDRKPRFPHHNFDALWGSHWSLNILWSFAYPEVMDAFCNTMVDMYKSGGLIPRGPSGGNYTYVMIGDPASSFFAAAYNKGIRNYDVKAAYEGLLNNARPGGIRDHAGYEHDKNACGGGMQYYIDRGYVPEDIEGKGGHKDGASMTLEYAYQDWCVAQLALALGHPDDAKWLLERSGNYRNVWDPSVQSMRPRNKDGSWLTPFELVGPHAAKGFCEANAMIYRHYVPHDVPGLLRLFGGPEKYVAALDQQFKLAAKDDFVTEHGMHFLQWVDYGNQPSTAMAHMFNLAGARG